MSGYGLGSRTEAQKVLASDPVGQVVNLGDRPTVPRALTVGMRELGESGRTREAIIGVNDGANPLLYG